MTKRCESGKRPRDGAWVCSRVIVHPSPPSPSAPTENTSSRDLRTAPSTSGCTRGASCSRACTRNWRAAWWRSRWPRAATASSRLRRMGCSLSGSSRAAARSNRRARMPTSAPWRSRLTESPSHLHRGTASYDCGTARRSRVAGHWPAVRASAGSRAMTPRPAGATRTVPCWAG